MLGVDSAADAEEVAFQLAQYRVDPHEGWVPGIAPATLHHDGLVVLDHFANGINGFLQPIASG